MDGSRGDEGVLSEESTQRLHTLELRLHAIESRLGFWRGLVIAAIAFLGVSTGAGLWTLYNRTLDEADRAIFEQARATVQSLRQQAEADALAVRAALASACHDPTWVEKTGRCIYPVMLNGHYTLNYGSAAAICAAQGARLCTLAEVRDAHAKGAQWCAYGWVADTERPGSGVKAVTGTVAYPHQTGGRGCGEAGVNVLSSRDILTENWGANCCL
jgi:hypothetical protein